MRTGTLAETFASERGGRPAIRRSTGTIMSWKVNIAEVGKPGRMITGLPSQTARHSGLPGFSATPWAMMPGFAEPADDAMGDVARALRGAARQHQHVAFRKRLAHRRFKRGLVIGDGAEKMRFAAILVDRRRDDRAIGVVDRGRPQRFARLHQFISGRDHRDARLARHRNFSDAAGRQHADLARTDDGAGAQQGLAARDVGAGIRDELPGRRGTADLDRARAGGLRVLDHHDGIRAARQRAAGRDRRRRARQHRPLRRDTAGDHLVVEPQAYGRGFVRRGEIGRAHRKAVDIGTVERRHVDRRRDVLAQRTTKRIRELARLAGDRPRKQRGLETRQAPPRATGWSGTGPDRDFQTFWTRGSGSSRCSFPQHIGIDGRSRSISFAAAGNQQPGLRARIWLRGEDRRPPTASRRHPLFRAVRPPRSRRWRRSCAPAAV